MTNKTNLFFIIAGVLVVIGGIGIWLSMGDAPTYQNVDSSRPFKGSAEAAVIVEEFSDFQCPACKSAQDTVKRVTSEFGDKIRFEFKHFPLTSIHPSAFRAALASECANDQGKFWEYHDLLFMNQPKFSPSELVSYAEGLGLDRESFSACLDSRAKNDVVRADMAEASSRQVNATPTFYVNGQIVQNWNQLSDVISAALGEQ